MERTAQCHCGSLRIIATGDPDRVYLCHCKACQRRTGTAFHFGASFRKSGCGLTESGRSTSATPTVAIAFDFISARIAAARSIGRETATPLSAESRWAHLTRWPFHRPATRSGRSQCIRGSACRRVRSITGKADHLSQIKRQNEMRLGNTQILSKIVLLQCCGSITWLSATNAVSIQVSLYQLFAN
jgi:hypothetical protein